MTPDQTPPKPIKADEGFGCFILILIFLIGGAVAGVFKSAGPSGAPWAAVAAVALSAMGLGIVYLGVKYRA